MRRVTRLAALDLDRSMFEDERPGLVSMTLDTIDVAACPRAQLFLSKGAMLIMAVGTFYSTFGDLVMEGPCKRRLLLSMALVTAVRFTGPQEEFGTFRCVRRVAIEAGYTVAEMFTAPEVEAFTGPAFRAFVALEADGGLGGRRKSAEASHSGRSAPGFVGKQPLGLCVLSVFDQLLGCLVILDVLAGRAMT